MLVITLPGDTPDEKTKALDKMHASEKLTIQVSGIPGRGKTELAVLVAKALTAFGLSVVYLDDACLGSGLFLNPDWTNQLDQLQAKGATIIVHTVTPIVPSKEPA